MTPPPDTNGSRRSIDAILLRELDRLEGRFDRLDGKLDELGNRVTRLETKATIRGMLGGALTTIITAVAGVLVWLWKGGP